MREVGAQAGRWARAAWKRPRLPPLGRAVMRRLGWAAGLVAAISVVIFAATESLPGDAAARLLGQNYTPERYAQVRHALNLDVPAPARYLRWAGGLLHGDLGSSARTGRAVSSVIADRIGSSLVLAGLAFVAILAVSLVLGVLAGSRAGRRLDAVVSIGSVVSASLPEFILAGGLIVVLASWLGLFPSVSLIPDGGSPLDRPSILVLPVLTLTVAGSAYATRLVRATVADASQLPHVESALLSGLPGARVVFRHLLPSAVGPIAQAYANLASYLVGGTVIVEQVFNYPGLGQLLVQSVNDRDVTIVQGVGLLVSTAVVGAFLLADLIGLAANPRARAAG